MSSLVINKVTNKLCAILPPESCKRIEKGSRKEKAENNPAVLEKKTTDVNSKFVEVSLHFALKKKIDPRCFTLKYNEAIHDSYFELKDTIFTTESTIWSKVRTITREEKEEQTVIIKCTETSEIDVASVKLELDIPTFNNHVYKHIQSPVLQILDDVQTTRQVYSYNEDEDIELTLGSTQLPDGKFYNHGTLRAKLEKQSALLDILSEIGNENFIFPQSSPVVIRLLMKNKGDRLKNIITDVELLENMKSNFTVAGLYCPENINEEEELC